MRLDASVAAVVTGGASGLGAATVRQLRSFGVACTILDRDEACGLATARECGAAFEACDVTLTESVDSALARARDRHGTARILVNCAGVGMGVKVASRSRSTGAISGHSIDDFQKIVDINLLGTFRTMVRFATDLLAEASIAPDAERGVIVNTASIAAEDGQQGQVAYAASKAAIVGLTLPAARDLGREGIRIMTILPGFFSTPLTARADEAAQRRLIDHAQFPQRGGHAEEYAQLVAHICQNPMLNGSCIRLDAGARLPAR